MTFEEVPAVLVETGARAGTSHHDPSSFGSWYAEFSLRGSRLRLVWDGKERWLMLQEQGGRPGDWCDLEIARDGEDQSATRVADWLSTHASSAGTGD